MENNTIIKTELWAYVSKTADKETVVRVEKWMHSDEYDEKLFTEIISVYKKTGSNQPVSLRIAKERFFKTVETDKQDSFQWKKIFKYVAIIAFVITSSIAVYQKFSIDNKQVLVQTTYGEHKKIDLPDGSIVWLNASSKLSYSEVSSRKVYLEGEAFFEVAKDKEHPFIVRTIDRLNVKALGTSFNVKSYVENNFTETVLYTGKVEVTSDKHFEDRIILLPKDKIIFSRETNRIVKSKAEFMESIIAWKDGKIQFKNKPFYQLAKDLSVQYNIQIRFENEQLSQSKFTGSFDESTPIKEILETLKLSKDFEFKQIDEFHWIIK